MKKNKKIQRQKKTLVRVFSLCKMNATFAVIIQTAKELLEGGFTKYL